MRHCHAPDDAEDVLARRYHAELVLGRLHRGLAVAELARLRDGGDGDVSLERALGVYDMFVVGPRKGITRILRRFWMGLLRR